MNGEINFLIVHSCLRDCCVTKVNVFDASKLFFYSSSARLCVVRTLRTPPCVRIPLYAHIPFVLTRLSSQRRP